MMGNLVYIMNKYKWKIVMKEEMDALDKNKTWGLVELPNNSKIVGCK
jgi:N-acyl-L-homoserine lactone synthetase